MKFLKVSNLLLIISVIAISCSRKEVRNRQHVDTKPATQVKETALAESKNIKFEDIFNSENLKDDDFLNSQSLINDFQKILDKELKNKSSKEKIIKAYNENCSSKIYLCAFSKFFKYDNRLVSLVIENFSSIKNQRDFLEYLFSINYIGENKWKLLAKKIQEDDDASIYRDIFFNSLKSQKNSYKKYKNIDSLILKVNPKKTSSWYDYLSDFMALDIGSDEVDKLLINKALAEQEPLICDSMKIKFLTVGELSFSSFCDKKEDPIKRILNQDIMLNNLPKLIKSEHKELIDAEQVKKFIMKRGFFLMEKSLLNLKDYYDFQLKNNRVSNDFIARMREHADNKINPEWSRYLDDVKSITEVLFNNAKVDVKIRDLEQQLINFFATVMEVPFNLILASRLMDVGHREVLHFGPIKLVIDSATIGKQLFSGKMDQMVGVLPRSFSAQLDPLRITWAIQAMQKFSITKIFDVKLDESFLIMFNQSIESDYKLFDSMYQKFLRRDKKIGEFKSKCNDLENGTYSFKIDFGKHKGTSALNLGPGSIDIPSDGHWFETFENAYLKQAREYHMTEAFEIYRSEILPKIIIRNSLLAGNTQKHEIEKKIEHLKKRVRTESDFFEKCLFKMREVESEIANYVVKKEIEFADYVNKTLLDLESGKITKMPKLKEYTDIVSDNVHWADFHEDFIVKYGFQKNGEGFYFADDATLRYLRLAHYLMKSKWAKAYTFDFGSYNTVLKNNEDRFVGNIYKTHRSAEKFFVEHFEKLFELLSYRYLVVNALMKLNLFDVQIQKISLDQTREESFEVFERAYQRAKSFIKYYNLRDWELKLMESFQTVCPSCGSRDRYRGPRGFLASDGIYGNNIPAFAWNPLDAYFELLQSRSLGINADLRNYLSFDSVLFITVKQADPGGNMEPGRGGGVVDAENFFRRENPWQSISRITSSYNLVEWDLLSDFGDGALDQVSALIKHDMILAKRLIEFSKEKSSKENFDTYSFSTLYDDYTPQTYISDHVVNTYNEYMDIFHRQNINLYKLDEDAQ